MRDIIMAGNWKMNLDASAVEKFCNELLEFSHSVEEGVKMIIAPAYPFLAMGKLILSGTGVELAAQDVSFRSDGAFTGEVSNTMLASLDLKYCIIGHSERRQYHSETDRTVNARLKKLLEVGITPIVCLGETLEEREGNRTQEVVLSQLKGCFDGIGLHDIGKCIIAYEPVWAIGTGRTATPTQAQEVHALIRKWLEDQYDNQTSQELHILYGGSAKPENIRELLMQPDIDGGLIGGASIVLAQYSKMIQTACEVYQERKK